jgi:predicted enzyme involved in methoxymalonyl-ACP biosynthesis
VETAILDGLVEEIARMGAEELRAAFVPTAKNGAAAGFLPSHGFTRLEDGSWRLPLISRHT